MNILALDASTDACSVALLVDNSITERYELAPQKHTELLLPMVDSLLVQAKLSLNQLDAIAVAFGPGSFTGVRLAISVAQGLAFGANIPIIPISTLQTIAQGIFTEQEHKNIVVVQDARMQEVYLGVYQANADGEMSALIPDSLCKPEAIKLTFVDNSWVIIGSALEVYQDILSYKFQGTICRQNVFPRAKYVAALAKTAWQKKLFISPENAMPQYLRNEVAWNT